MKVHSFVTETVLESRYIYKDLAWTELTVLRVHYCDQIQTRLCFKYQRDCFFQPVTAKPSFHYCQNRLRQLMFRRKCKRFTLASSEIQNISKYFCFISTPVNLSSLFMSVPNCIICIHLLPFIVRDLKIVKYVLLSNLLQLVIVIVILI